MIFFESEKGDLAGACAAPEDELEKLVLKRFAELEATNCIFN